MKQDGIERHMLVQGIGPCWPVCRAASFQHRRFPLRFILAGRAIPGTAPGAGRRKSGAGCASAILFGILACRSKGHRTLRSHEFFATNVPAPKTTGFNERALDRLVTNSA
jgi:hypothetical protein